MSKASRRMNKSKKYTRRVKKGRKSNRSKKHSTKTHRSKRTRFSRTNNMPKLARELQDAIRRAGGGQPTMMNGGGQPTMMNGGTGMCASSIP